VKYQATASFLADYRRLSDDERALFREAVRLLNQAYEQRGDRAFPQWPTSLRIRGVQGATGVWEMTWSFTRPDGRATFSFITIAGELAVRWRRVGDHRIFDEP
jgi:hypothetical protein